MSHPLEYELEMTKPNRVSPAPSASNRTIPPPLAPLGARISYFNSPEKNRESKFVSNVVVTSKYSLATFIPRNLFEQFRRRANIYFLLISCLQLFTDLSPTSKYTTAGPLAAVLFFSMLREAFEDFKRHKADNEVNGRFAHVLRGSELHEIPWREIVVGDIVKVDNKKEFPTDLLLISSSDAHGLCYIETANLDGETNLKLRLCVDATKALVDPAALASIHGRAEYEEPNNRLYNFDGKVSIEGVNGGLAIPLEVNNVVLRGAVLRNTKHIFGFVLFTGRETKIMMNSRAAPSKRSNVEKEVDSVLLIVLGLDVTLCAICTILMATFVPANRGAWYIPYVQTQTSLDTVLGFVTFFILYNNFVPISLYVTVELVKLAQAIFINNDLEMYHLETDTPALARTSNLNEELGQIEYIFSDKTGTLTRNEMEFRKCSISGKRYGFGTTEIGRAAAARGGLVAENASGEDVGDAKAAQFNFDSKFSFDDPRLLAEIRKDSAAAPHIRECLQLLAVCHTVVPERDKESSDTSVMSIQYQAESPDEGALVHAARCLGYAFCGKSASSVTVRVMDEEKSFSVLNVNKFNSTRKRMSVVVRLPDGCIVLYCKGADNVMIPRLKNSPDWLKRDLSIFATEGLRTLVLARKELSEEVWSQWNARHYSASTALQGRDDKLDQVAEEVETEMEVVAATGIEDKLQLGVPDAIASLSQAGLKIWVLTGDKEETAINIGFACQLLDDEMDLIKVNGASVDIVAKQLSDGERKTISMGMSDANTCALVLDGQALTVIEEEANLRLKLLKFEQSRLFNHVVLRASARQ
jgi:phospholipid-transporting ATPase